MLGGSYFIGSTLVTVGGCNDATGVTVGVATTAAATSITSDGTTQSSEDNPVVAIVAVDGGVTLVYGVDIMLESIPDFDDKFLMEDRVIAKFVPIFMIEVRLVR